MLNVKHILVPVDFSKESLFAVDWAVMIARGNPEASITLCAILTPDTEPLGAGHMRNEEYERYYGFKKKAWEARLAAIRAQRIPPRMLATYVVGRGEVEGEIDALCDVSAVDLVVIATHGRRGWDRWWKGSVAERLARTASCPVLVLHLNAPQQKTLDVAPMRVEEKEVRYAS